MIAELVKSTTRSLKVDMFQKGSWKESGLEEALSYLMVYRVLVPTKKDAARSQQAAPRKNGCLSSSGISRAVRFYRWLLAFP